MNYVRISTGLYGALSYLSGTPKKFTPSIDCQRWWPGGRGLLQWIATEGLDAPDCFLGKVRVPAGPTLGKQPEHRTWGISNLWPDALRDIEYANKLPQGGSDGRTGQIASSIEKGSQHVPIYNFREKAGTRGVSYLWYISPPPKVQKLEIPQWDSIS